MSDANGHKPSMDVNLLAPNDYRALRKRMAEAGMDLDDTLSSGHSEDVVQTLILGFSLRKHPEMTWEEAGAIAAPEVFDMSSGDREPDPPIAPPGSPGRGQGTPNAAGSRPARSRPASAPS